MDADSSSSSTSPPPLPKSPTRKRIISSNNGDQQQQNQQRSSGSDRHSKRRSKDVIAGSIKDLARLLGYQEREVRELQGLLYTVTEQLKNEKRRADESDRKALEAAHKFRNAENARIIAAQDATRANEVRKLGGEVLYSLA
jgi:hypothetical protein